MFIKTPTERTEFELFVTLESSPPDKLADASI